MVYLNFESVVFVKEIQLAGIIFPRKVTVEIYFGPQRDGFAETKPSPHTFSKILLQFLNRDK